MDQQRDSKRVEDFNNLLVDNAKAVFRFALRLTGSYEDAEDLSQEAFIRAYKAFRSFKGKSSFKTWIFRIVLNLSKDFYKKRAKGLSEVSLEKFGMHLADMKNGSKPAYCGLEDLFLNQPYQRLIRLISPHA